MLAKENGSTYCFEMKEYEYIEGSENYTGACTGCGSFSEGVEPDAQEYICDVCERSKVYGLEELLLMGLVTLN